MVDITLTHHGIGHLGVCAQATEPLTDEPLLRYYAGEWTRYTTDTNFVNRLFAYLNRHWVKREKDEV